MRKIILPFNSKAKSSPSVAINGKTSFSIDVGFGCDDKTLLDVTKQIGFVSR